MLTEQTNEENAFDHEESAAAAVSTFRERRASLEKLQFMMKRVSESPFHKAYRDGELLVKSSSAAKDEDENQQVDIGQTGTGGDLSRTNPFSKDYLVPTKPAPPPRGNLSRTQLPKSTHQFKSLFPAADGGDSPPAERSREENLFGKPPVNGLVDPFKSPSNEEDDLFLSPRPPAGRFDAAVNTPELFQAVPTKSENAFHSKNNKESLLDVSYENHLFSPSRKTSDSIPSPVTRDLFPDFSSLDDPLATTPSKHDLPPFPSNGTRDLVRTLPSRNTTQDMFNATSSNPDPGFSKSSLNGTSEMKSDKNPNSQDLFEVTTSESRPTSRPQTSFASFDDDDDATTSQEPTGDGLQPTPFTRARNLCVSTGQSPSDMTHVSTFRRPPRPLPRKRSRKPSVSEKPLVSEKPPVPEKPPTPVKHVKPDRILPNTPPKPGVRPPPKPVVPHKPKSVAGKAAEPEDYVVLQEILFIGQEKCVEDWPEDSPELKPDFKPSGTFRLRRESLKMKTDSEGGSGEDHEGAGSFRKKKDKRIKSLISRRGSKDKFPDDVKEGKSRTLPAQNKLSKDYFSDSHTSAGEIDEEEQNGMDYKKNPLKAKVSMLLRRTSTSSSAHEGKVMNGHLPQDRSHDDIPGAHGFTAPRTRQTVAMDDDDYPGLNGEPYGMDGGNPKKSKQKGFFPKSFKSKSTGGQSDQFGYNIPNEVSNDVFAENNFASAADFSMPPGETYDGQHNFETSKPKKSSILKTLKLPKFKRKSSHSGAAPMSEAAQAEWLSAQIDERGDGDEEDGEEDGDTDSLMEWWYTVEQWDEVPSDEEDNAKTEDERESFQILADKIVRGLRVFNKVFTERAEVLWQYIIMLHAIADDIEHFHQKAIVAGITGGTTTAVGGATAIAGLALAPFTFGFSLILTAVGVGVATAGGITSASAAISDSVNNMQDSKKVEIILQEYEAHLLDMGKILHFVNHALYKIRGHPFLRCGTQHYSEDWEVRRAVQIISLVDTPVMRAMDITDSAVASVQGLFKGMDQYFTKESRELKKGCNREVVGRIKGVANVLNNGIMELNSIRDELQESTGGM
ncbi:uncharacterized protein [Antennarius striatus]|uniref:uncharacterized protein isoform X2 n=1 Tax=Antennarius striatus TaxID=241820 RepID=UPI0035B31EAA